MTKKQAKQGAKRSPSGRAQPRSWLPLAIIGGVLTLAVGAGAWFMRSSPAPAVGVAQGSPGANPPQATGGASAPVTLEEFGDYQCPPCGAVYPDLEKIKADYGDRVRLIFRHFPLTRIHPNALVAAHAAEAAGLQGKFWEMHDQLYRNQKSWEKSGDARVIFSTYARNLGLDAERFARDLNGEEADQRVVADHERARSLGVKGTPTFFLNGRELPSTTLTGKDLRAAIDDALNGQQ